MTANAERGEIPVKMDGRDFVLRPTFEAVQAIDAASGSIVALARRANDLALSDMALIVCEGIKAHGRHTKNQLLAAYTVDGVARLIVKSGVASVTGPVGKFLAAALTGGVVPEGEA